MRNLRPFVMILMSLGIGLAAMTVAAQWLRERSMQQTRPVLVAIQELAAGTRLERSMLEVVHWPKDALSVPALSRLEEAEGRVITGNLLRGEPVLLARLAATGETGGLSALLSDGRRAVTVKVNEIVGVAGFALPGNYVDVMVNTPDSQNNLVSKIVIERIQVLAVAQDVANLESKPKVVNAVTLEVTPAQAEKIDLARSVGSLSLVLRSQVDTESVATVGARKHDLLQGGELLEGTPLAKPLPRVARAIKASAAAVAAPQGLGPTSGGTTEVIRGLNKTRE